MNTPYKVEETVRQFQSLFCMQSIMQVDAQNEITNWLRNTFTQYHQDMMSEVESVDIERNRELYGNDFAAGMMKMKNIIQNRMKTKTDETKTDESFYRTVIDSLEWKLWTKHQEKELQYAPWDSLHIKKISPEHFEAFLEFVKTLSDNYADMSVFARTIKK